MRVSIVSIFLAGGMLAVGACAPVESGPMTLAERTDHCERMRAHMAPTGRQTGDARQDYRCQVHATTYEPGGRSGGERDKVIRRGG